MEARFGRSLSGVFTALLAGTVLGHWIMTTSAHAGCPAPSFEAEIVFPAGLTPISVLLSDFDRDGRLDLVVSDLLGNAVSVRAGHGNGDFAPPRILPTGSGPTSLISRDFNADGNLDLAVTLETGNAVSIFLGDANGDLRTHFGVPVETPVGMDSDDFNGDGRLDLVVGNFFDSSVTILRGAGDGSFDGPTTVQVGSQPIFVASADINLDGNSDLAVANMHDATVSILLGNGDGTFRPQSIVGVPGGNDLRSLAVGDFNRDAAPDLVVVNAFNGTAVILMGGGDGSFEQGPILTLGSEPIGVAVGDLNNDGNIDFVAANADDATLSVYPGNGDGTFGAEATFPVGGGAIRVAVGDVNLDGAPDLAAANFFDGTVSILLGACRTALDLPIDIKPGSASNSVNPRSLGRIPVAVLSTESFNVSMSLDIGSLTFGRTGEEPSLASCSREAEDINGDSRPDLLCHFSTGDTGLQPGDDQGILKGQTLEGRPVEGRDAIRIVGWPSPRIRRPTSP